MIKNFIFLFISLLIFVIGVLLYGSLLRFKNANKPNEEKLIANGDSTAVSIKVDIRKYKLILLFDNNPVKEYRIFLGHSKSRLGSLRKGFVTTPIGKYQVVSIDSSRMLYKKINLNYPNLEDLKEAFENKFIGEKEFKFLWKNLTKNNKVTPNKKVFGPAISIEGFGKLNYILKNLPFVFNWTNGSIAMSNEDIDELLKYIKVGTKVKIVD